MGSKPDRPSDGMHRAPTVQGAEYLGAGIQFAASIVFFLLAGNWLDARLGTEPWLLILGVVIGAGGGFYSLYRQLVTVPEKRRREGKERR